MYLYSSDTNSLKIMLSKSDAEQFILNQPSLTMRKSIIQAIFKAALPKSKFTVYKENISARLIEYPEGKFILEFTKNQQIKRQDKKVLHCYYCANLNELARILRQLIAKNARISRLYFKGDRYFLLSEKCADSKICNSSEHIEGVLEEYAHLISKNAAKEIERLL